MPWRDEAQMAIEVGKSRALACDRVVAQRVNQPWRGIQISNNQYSISQYIKSGAWGRC